MPVFASFCKILRFTKDDSLDFAFFFGKPRQGGSSHVIYKTPWIGDPRVNIQNEKGMAKAYQVKQVLQAIERLENENPAA